MMDGACSTHRREQKLPNILAEKSKGKRALGRSTLIWNDDIKMNLIEKEWSAWTGWLMMMSIGRLL
jgi:hypothetical protein